jgi:hypothetical protein
LVVLEDPVVALGCERELVAELEAIRLGLGPQQATPWNS